MGESIEGSRRGSLKRIARIALGVTVSAVAILGAGCSPDRIAAPSRNADLTVHGTVAHAVVGDADTFPFSWEQVNCNNGEVVPYSGHETVNVHFVPPGNLHLQFDFHTTVDGTGDLGNVYHGAAEDSYVLNDPSTLGFEYTQVHNVIMNSTTAPDMHVKVLVHMTVSATGEWTASVETIKDDCPAM